MRVRSAKAVYVVQYRFARATQRESLGDIRKLKLEEARKVARQYFAKVELGQDPRAEKRKADEEAGARQADLRGGLRPIPERQGSEDAAEYL